MSQTDHWVITSEVMQKVALETATKLIKIIDKYLDKEIIVTATEEWHAEVESKIKEWMKIMTILTIATLLQKRSDDYMKTEGIN